MKIDASENALSESIRRLLTTLGIAVHFRVNSGALPNPKGKPVHFLYGPDGKWFHGFSDRFFLMPGTGRFVAIEVKRPAVPALKQKAGEPTDHQVNFLRAVNATGGVGFYASDLGVVLRVVTILRRDPHARFDIDGTHIDADGHPVPDPHPAPWLASKWPPSWLESKRWPK